MAERKKKVVKEKIEKGSIDFSYIITQDIIDVDIPDKPTDKQLAVAYMLVLQDLMALSKRLDLFLPRPAHVELLGTQKTIDALLRSLKLNIDEDFGIVAEPPPNLQEIAKKIMDGLKNGDFPPSGVMAINLKTGKQILPGDLNPDNPKTDPKKKKDGDKGSSNEPTSFD